MLSEGPGLCPRVGLMFANPCDLWRGRLARHANTGRRPFLAVCGLQDRSVGTRILMHSGMKVHFYISTYFGTNMFTYFGTNMFLCFFGVGGGGMDGGDNFLW